jgi:SAM-dependent methyltransferase
LTPEQRWLAALWPKVRSYLPAPPAIIVEVGCGRLGGFVPRLRDSGYQAIGIDPAAPEGDEYRRVEFERSDIPTQVDGVLACTSLHHVGDPDEVLDKIAMALAPSGVIVVVEWDWESFDEAAAHWCFERLGPPEQHSHLHRRRDEWRTSGQSWENYLRSWTKQEDLHSARDLIRELDRRFERLTLDCGAYFFPDLAGTTEADELDAISRGELNACRVDYVGRVGSG